MLMKRILTAIMLLVGMAAVAVAQDYRYEIGGGLGASGYLGDVNKGNVLKNQGLAGGLVFRYLPSTRWAVKAHLDVSNLSGNSAENNMAFPEGMAYSFSSTVCGVGGQIEFNFLNYGIGATYLKLKRITPYLTIGLGAELAFAEGQTGFAMNIPMGMGVKYKVKERLNIGFELTMRKSLGDKVDGLSDLNGIKHSFAKNTDWYSVAMFTVSYEFGKRCKTCHYVE